MRFNVGVCNWIINCHCWKNEHNSPERTPTNRNLLARVIHRTSSRRRATWSRSRLECWCWNLTHLRSFLCWPGSWSNSYGRLIHWESHIIILEERLAKYEKFVRVWQHHNHADWVILFSGYINQVISRINLEPKILNQKEKWYMSCWVTLDQRNTLIWLELRISICFYYVRNNICVHRWWHEDSWWTRI
jgi:hypothetical protein